MYTLNGWIPNTHQNNNHNNNITIIITQFTKCSRLITTINNTITLMHTIQASSGIGKVGVLAKE